MSMSVDTRQLELATQFAELLELLINPKKLEDIVNNMKAVSADYKEKLGLIATKQDADIYRAQAVTILEEAKAYLSKEKQRQDGEAAQVLADLTAKKAEVERTLQTLSKRLSEAEDNLAKSKTDRAEASRILVEAFDRKRDIDAKTNELSRLEVKLNEKQAKLNQILG